MQNISVIIPTLNAQETIGKLLDYLTQQSVDILILDSASTDNTIDIVKQYEVNYLVIPKEEFDHGGTRRFGAKHCKEAEFLIYLTQDALPYDENALQNILLPFEDEKVGAVCGRQIAYPHENSFGEHLREYNYSDTSHIRSYEDRAKYGIKTPFLSNSFAAYRRSALEDIGFFSDGLIFGEDMYAAAKMLQKGYKIAYQSQAKVYHSHSYSYLQELRRYFDMGVFHTQEAWLLEDFGKAEGEGKKFVISQIKFLFNKGKWYLLPS
ncbi:MAG: glycosyltransferase family 2 protein, partial [Campylobacterales bacterium]|nr:glycosyltransferase family 2 protein [Campylobacterales bacterium]